MAELDEVATLTVQGESTGVDRVVTSLNAVSDAQVRVGETSLASATVQESAATKQLSAAAAYDKLRASIDSSYQSQLKFGQGVTTLDKAFSQGLINETAYATQMENLHAKYSGVVQDSAQVGGSLGFLNGIFGQHTVEVGRSNETLKAFRETTHTIDPALKEMGAGISGLTMFTGAARGGFVLLATAISGAFVAALEMAGDRSIVANERLATLLGNTKQASEVMDALSQVSVKTGIDLGDLTGAFEKLATQASTSSIVLKSAPGVDVPNMRLGTLAINQQVAALTSFSESLSLGRASAAQSKDALNTLYDAINKGGTISIATLQKIDDLSPKLGHDLAAAFGIAGGNFQQWIASLNGAGVSVDNLLSHVIRFKPYVDAAFDAAPALTLSQSFDRLKASFFSLLDEVAKQTGFHDLAGVVQQLTGYLNDLAKDPGPLIEGFNNFAGAVRSVAAAIRELYALGQQAVAFWNSIQPPAWLTGAQAPGFIGPPPPPSAAEKILSPNGPGSSWLSPEGMGTNLGVPAYPSVAPGNLPTMPFSDSNLMQGIMKFLGAINPISSAGASELAQGANPMTPIGGTPVTGVAAPGIAPEFLQLEEAVKSGFSEMSAATTAGFSEANANLTGITAQFSGTNAAITSGFAATDAAVAGGFGATDAAIGSSFATTDAALSGLAATDASVSSSLAATSAAITGGFAGADAAFTVGFGQTNAELTSGFATTDAALTSGFATTSEAITPLNATFQAGVDAFQSGFTQLDSTTSAGLSQLNTTDQSGLNNVSTAVSGLEGAISDSSSKTADAINNGPLPSIIKSGDVANQAGHAGTKGSVDGAGNKITSAVDQIAGSGTQNSDNTTYNSQGIRMIGSQSFLGSDQMKGGPVIPNVDSPGLMKYLLATGEQMSADLALLIGRQTHGAPFNTGADITFSGSGGPDSIYVPMYVSPGERMIVLPAGQANMVPPTGLPGSFSAGGFFHSGALGGSMGPTPSTGIGPGGPTAVPGVMSLGATGGSVPMGGFGGPVGSPAVASPGIAGPPSAAQQPSVYGNPHWSGGGLTPILVDGRPPTAAEWQQQAAIWQATYGTPMPMSLASGIDYMIPGSGPPDSVSLPLHVSPGERLIVLPAGMAGLVPDLGLPGLSGAAAGGVFAAGGIDTGVRLPSAPAGSPADMGDAADRIEAAIDRFVESMASGKQSGPAITVNVINPRDAQGVAQSARQAYGDLARNIAALSR